MSAIRAALVTSIVLTSCARVAVADEPQLKNVPSVQQLCQAARAFALKSPERVRIFSIVPFGDDPNAVLGDWREFPDIATRDKLAETRPIYDSLGVWKAPSGSYFVTTHSTSFTGDWGHMVDYCFRTNGTLAWMESELRTFYGSVRRVRTRRFDANGRVTFSGVRVFNLQTDEPLQDPSFMDQDEPIYVKLKDLPVAELLRQRKAVRRP